MDQSQMMYDLHSCEEHSIHEGEEIVQNEQNWQEGESEQMNSLYGDEEQQEYYDEYTAGHEQTFHEHIRSDMSGNGRKYMSQQSFDGETDQHNQEDATHQGKSVSTLTMGGCAPAEILSSESFSNLNPSFGQAQNKADEQEEYEDKSSSKISSSCSQEDLEIFEPNHEDE